MQSLGMDNFKGANTLLLDLISLSRFWQYFRMDIKFAMVWNGHELAK